MASKQMAARKITVWLGGILVLSLLSFGTVRAQEACLPTDSAEIARIDQYIYEMQYDSAKLTAFLDKVLQHPQYSVIIEPILAGALLRLDNPSDADKEANVLLTESDWARIKEIVCMLLRSPSSTPVQTPPPVTQTPPPTPTTTIPPKPPEATVESPVRIWYALNDKEYKQGDKIEVKYQRENLNLAFLLKHYPEGTKAFQWSLRQDGGEDITALVKNNAPDLNNFGVNLGGQYGDMTLTVKYDDAEISIHIKILKDKFDLIQVLAYPDGKKDRVAKEGQTLYLVDGYITNSSTDVIYDTEIKPDLGESKYGPSEISWRYKDQTQYRYEQFAHSRRLIRTLKEEDPIITTTVEAGYPTVKTKSVHVKWVDGKARSYEFVEPQISSIITKTFEATRDGLKMVDRVLSTVSITDKDVFKIAAEPIKIAGKIQNVPDEKSRLYKEVKTGSISGGVKGELKRSFTHPVLEALAKLGIAEANVYIAGSVGVGLSGGVDLERLCESNKTTGTSPYVEISAQGCLEVGAEASVEAGKDYVTIAFKASGQACLAGGLKQSKLGGFEGKLALAPIVAGVSAKVTSNTFGFDLLDFTKSVTLTDEIVIFPIPD